MILSVDPGKRCGWCRAYLDPQDMSDHEIGLLNGAPLRESGVIDGDNVRLINDIIIDEEAPIVLVIESQYAKRYTDAKGKSGINFKAVETLMLRAHRWIVLAELYGIEAVRVKPSVWQAYFHLKPGDKAAIVALAGSIAGRQVIEDEADAILIGEHYRLTEVL